MGAQNCRTWNSCVLALSYSLSAFCCGSSHTNCRPFLRPGAVGGQRRILLRLLSRVEGQNPEGHAIKADYFLSVVTLLPASSAPTARAITSDGLASIPS